MITFEIQGVMIDEPKYDNKYVKFLIKHICKKTKESTIIPISIFRNKFNVDYTGGNEYIVQGGFDAIPTYKKGFFLVYNATKITIAPE